VLIRLVDIALDATFLTIYNLSKFRNYLTFRKPANRKNEAAGLVAEWLEACQKRDALRSELEAPTISRLYDTQATLIRTTKDAGDKCHYLLVKLRDHGRGPAIDSGSNGLFNVH
jgi:hypothetical protein